MSRRLAASLLLAACGGDRLLGDSADETTTSVATATDTSFTSDTSASSSGIDTTSSTTSPTEPDTSSSNGGDDDSCAFLCSPDNGPTNLECDEWAQDCPRGQKCMPWANDGGSSWNATRCFPIAPDPAQPGEPCTVEGSAFSGVDDCALASMCWEVDPETNMGICYDFCRGSESNPVCLDPASHCGVAGDGILILCIPTCDPLAQDCAEGLACYPGNDTFSCFPDAGDEDAFGAACEFLNACDPGLYCADSADVPGCAGSTGCCNSFCDLAVDDPDALCPAVADGQVCVPWYELGHAPPEFVNVGHCAVPP